MHVLALSVELRIPGCTSLKQKRSALRPIVEGIRQRHHVSVAETDFNDQWQRAAIGVAVVSGSVSQAEDLADKVERFVWSRPDVEVTHAGRHWLEVER
jgi:uncharacterized protein YlxP (DUF503 family)